jgi:hypothetical protein
MSTQRTTGGSIDLDGAGDLRDDEDNQYLLTALQELLDRLSGRGPDGTVVPSEAVEQWEGEEFFYVETPLARAAGVEIDVSIQGGRAFIRMAR